MLNKIKYVNRYSLLQTIVTKLTISTYNSDKIVFQLYSLFKNYTYCTKIGNAYNYYRI